MFHSVIEQRTGIVAIYLAGPIDGLPIQKATTWRNYLTEQLEQIGRSRAAPCAFRVLDPLRGFLLPSAKGTDIIAVGVTTTPLVRSCNVVDRALHDINKADAIIFHAPEGHLFGPGSNFEFGYACAQGKTCIVVGDQPSLPLFMRELCDYCVPDLSQVIPLIQTLIA